MSARLHPDDLAFLDALAVAGSLTAAARELNVSTAAVSKRLSAIEHRFGVTLVRRTTRRMSLTPEGEICLQHARRILADLHDLEQLVSGSRIALAGLLRVNATLGFGRRHVAPVVSRFVRKYPQVGVQLQLSSNPSPLVDDAYDICIRFGSAPDARVIARRLAANRRLLVASPAYLARRGTPQTPQDLLRHDCIGIRQGDEGYGLWRLTGTRAGAREAVAIKTHAMLATNDGEIAVNWALDGHGIVMRAEWDVASHLRAGRLVEVLPDHRTPAADIYAIYPQRHRTSARVRAFVDFLAASLTEGGTPH
jgi:DNA-binding transcriptional LysR family regulator